MARRRCSRPQDVARVHRRLPRRVCVAAEAEITLEANPETVTVAKIAGLSQPRASTASALACSRCTTASFARLDRQHSAARARQALAHVRTAGIDNVSLDSDAVAAAAAARGLAGDARRLIDLAPDHASLYLLELYPNAPLKETMARERWSLAPDDDAAEMYLWALERLEDAGYDQYEISNVARAAGSRATT